MPNTASAKKALRQNTKRRAQNRSQRSTLKTLLKKTRTAVEGGEGKDQSAALMSESAKKLDQAASRNLIHKNKAARLKSRLAKALRKTESKPAAPAPTEET
jgi:small subunit ribosomal protein S20